MAPGRNQHDMNKLHKGATQLKQVPHLHAAPALSLGNKAMKTVIRTGTLRIVWSQNIKT